MNKETYFENIKSFKYLANKSLGQNFLINPEIAEKIVKMLDISDDDIVLEIGAGLGSLSVFLADQNAKTTLIDIDERMLTYLNEKFDIFPNVEVRRQNILKEDVSKYTKIIGNLPYYITSSIIEHILLNSQSASKIVLMTQKEVYPKLLSNNVSPLSLFLNYVAEISAPISVGRNSFIPIPHVDSVVFSLIPNEKIKNEENKSLLKLMQKIFLHRRKTILNCLEPITKDKKVAEDILNKMKVATNLRPEQLDIDFYLNLLKVLKSNDFMNKIIL